MKNKKRNIGRKRTWREGGRGNRGRFRRDETAEYVRVLRRALGVAAPLDRDKGTLSAARRGGSYHSIGVRA